MKARLFSTSFALGALVFSGFVAGCSFVPGGAGQAWMRGDADASLEDAALLEDADAGAGSDAHDGAVEPSRDATGLDAVDGGADASVSWDADAGDASLLDADDASFDASAHDARPADAMPDAEPIEFRYTPSNFDLDEIPVFGPRMVVDCSTSLDTDTLVFDRPSCVSIDTDIAIIQTEPETVLIPVTRLEIPVGVRFGAHGPRPLIIAVRGDAVVEGAIDVGGRLDDDGAGGGLAPECDVGAGGHGADADDVGRGGSGGGGGAFGLAGGEAGRGSPQVTGGGEAGQPNGHASLQPLRGGCRGGDGGRGGGGTLGGAGGAAGGAVQISAAGVLFVAGGVHANGAGGLGGAHRAGGGGGGSGGAILLEADAVQILSSARILASGGGGGEGGGCCPPRDGSGAAGSAGVINGLVPAPGGAGDEPTGGDGGNGGVWGIEAVAGGNGAADSQSRGGGGGGGGGIGRVLVWARGLCEIAEEALIGPPPGPSSSEACLRR